MSALENTVRALFFFFWMSLLLTFYLDLFHHTLAHHSLFSQSKLDLKAFWSPSFRASLRSRTITFNFLLVSFPRHFFIFSGHVSDSLVSYPWSSALLSLARLIFFYVCRVSPTFSLFMFPGAFFHVCHCFNFFHSSVPCSFFPSSHKCK